MTSITTNYILVISVTQPQQSFKYVAIQPYVASVTLMSLIIGIILTSAGMAVVEYSLNSVFALFLVLGVIFLAASFAARRVLSDSNLLESSTALALYVAVEFLAGAVLVLIGIGNLVFPSEGLDWSLVAATVFGLLLAADSLLLYRRDFKQVAGKKKGV
ncbi:hypothetical protein IMZ48_39290 [Candidatus Bathyarchaeota archaeon]|nr:hypothetical protein [Candidatus Bathyarchaeota archaeon]